MAAIDDLFSNPAFVFGASLLGTARQPGAINQSFGLASRVNELKAQQQAQQAQQQLGRDTLNETSRYHTGQLNSDMANRFIQEQQYQRQNALAQQQIAADARKQAMQEALMKYAASAMGIPLNLPQVGQQAEDAASGDGGSQGNAAPAGMAPMRADYNIPPQGHLNPNPPVGQMPGEDPRGIAAGANFMPLPQANLAPTPAGTFNPDDPNDPAGPMTHLGNYGQRALDQRGRPNLRTSYTMNDILNGIQQVESGGNPRAINPQSGAMGPYQFMPGTVDQIRQRNPNFSPFDPAQARAEAARLIQQRVAARGGNLGAALADYGGFKTQDPSGYIRKVAAAAQASGGGGAAPIPTNPQAVAAGGMDPGAIAKLGALMAMGGMQGGTALVGAANALEPKSVQPNSYQRDASGKMTFIPPTPVDMIKLEQEARAAADAHAKVPGEMALTQAQIGHTQAETANTQANAAQNQNKVRGDVAKQNYEFQNNMDKLDALAKDADALAKMPGFDYNAGWKGLIPNNMLPPGDATDARAKMDILRSRTMRETIDSLRSASSNGSLGFRLTQQELGLLGNYMTNLQNTKQSPAQMRQNLKDLSDWATKAKQRYTEMHNTAMGDNAAPAAPSAPAAPQTNYEKRGFKLVQ